MFIVKVQRSRYPTTDQMFIYNEDNSIWFMGPMDPDVAELLGKRPKGYFKAFLKDTKIQITDLAKDQPW